MKRNWHAPWEPIRPQFFNSATRELQRELTAGHLLFGAPMRAIGRRVDTDDSPFEMLDGSGRIAVVHLTYSRETQPEWPHTEIHNSWESFAQRMKEDADQR